MGLKKGENIIKDKPSTIQKFIDAKIKGTTNDNHYFYIIQFPECGSSRIKLGITANIYARFKYYQQHLLGSDIIIHRLQKLPKQIKDRYGDNAQKLYEVYEREAKYLLRDFNPDKIKNGSGVLTEWFPKNSLVPFLAKYDKWAENDFENTKIEKTIKRDAINRSSKNKVNYKEGSVKDRDIADKGIDRSSTKRN